MAQGDIFTYSQASEKRPVTVLAEGTDLLLTPTETREVDSDKNPLVDQELSRHSDAYLDSLNTTIVRRGQFG